MLTVCLDESGKFGGGHARVAFGGWISDEGGWASFQREWKQYLKSRGLQSLHTGELLNHADIYQGVPLTWEDKIEVLRSCLRITNKNALAFLGCAVDCEGFRRMSPESQRKCDNDAHMFCFNRVIRIIIDAFQDLDSAEDPDSHYNHPIGLIFDDNREYAVKCYQMLDTIKERSPAWRQRIGSICFVKDELYEPMQAADALAWLLANRLKAMTNPNPRHRLTLAAIDDLLKVATTSHQTLRGKTPLYDTDELQRFDRTLQGGNQDAAGL